VVNIITIYQYKFIALNFNSYNTNISFKFDAVKTFIKIKFYKSIEISSDTQYPSRDIDTLRTICPESSDPFYIVTY